MDNTHIALMFLLMFILLTAKVSLLLTPLWYWIGHGGIDPELGFGLSFIGTLLGLKGGKSE